MKFHFSSNCRILLHPFIVYSHTVHYYFLYAQVMDDKRRTIGQRETATRKNGTKCADDGHWSRVRLCSILAALQYPIDSVSVGMGHTVL